MSCARRNHEELMREALRLARLSPTLPYPNPWVGCVIARNGRIVGQGFHRGAGTNHAEIEALKQAQDQARGASLYVTLEPCSHFGRTPPCTDTILRAGIKEVFYSLRDPNPLVSGRGARLLKAQGLQVNEGLYSQEAAALNEVYLKFRATGLPFVTAKVATSLDGKIATQAGDSKWITDAAARRIARGFRAMHQAVVVGIGTVLADDPHLGARIRGREDPWRVVLDSRLRIPANCKVVQSGRCIVTCTARASDYKQRRLEKCGVNVWRFADKGRVPLKALLARLAGEGILSVLIEGGSRVLGSFFDSDLLDRVEWFLAPIIVGSARSRTAVGGRGAARLADAWKLRTPRITRTGNSYHLTGNLSCWPLASTFKPE